MGDQEDFIIEALAAAKKVNVPGVVLALTPGEIVTPWREQASAVVAMFLSGEETGNAAADVLMGDANPSGKLPVTFPAQENDTHPPCLETDCEFVGHGGWHIFDDKPVAYPFGYGLSYTTFRYSVVRDWSDPDGDELRRRITISVKNTG